MSVCTEPLCTHVQYEVEELIYTWYLDKERKAVNIVIGTDRDSVFDI